MRYNIPMIFKLIALTAACLTSVGFVPQIIKGIKTKKLDDVSTATLLITACGTTLWAIYGYHLGDPIIVGANIFTCSTVILLLAMQVIFRSR